MGILDSMKQDIAKSGGNKKKIFYVKDGGKRRVRFLKDFEDGLEMVFHDSFSKGVNCVCALELGEKRCKHCGNEDLRTRKQYGWPVYDYDANEALIFLFPVNNCSPVPSLISMYEAYGTLLDRDYVIEKKGKQQSTSYSVIPMDKAKFKSKDKVKVPSNSAMINVIGKAFSPDAEVSNDSEEETERPDYEELTPKELYKLCEEREIEAEPKMKAAYYIKLLEEWDESEDDDPWDDDTDSEDSDDEW